jgi:hypothetical protein
MGDLVACSWMKLHLLIHYSRIMIPERTPDKKHFGIIYISVFILSGKITFKTYFFNERL